MKKIPNSSLIMVDTSSSSSSSHDDKCKKEPLEQSPSSSPPRRIVITSERARRWNKLFEEDGDGWYHTLTEKTKATPFSKPLILNYVSPEDEDMDPPLYFEKRLKTLASHKAQGKNTYPHGFTVSLSIPGYIQKYAYLETDQHLDSVVECLSGRVMNKLSSSNLITYDLLGSGGQVQVMAFPKLSDMDHTDFFKSHGDLKSGDYVGIIGFPGKNSMGELSIILKSVVILSYCLRKMPPMHTSVKNIDVWTPGSARYPDAYTLNDQETRYRQRFLDMTINSEVKDIFKIRSKAISYTRHFLENLGFLEVETPSLTMASDGGAATRRVATYDDDLHKKSAPELYLKQLLVGGMDRVFEIGKQFTNKGIDRIHNPEFTTCGFCMALADYKDLMELTEQMLSGMVKELTGGYKVTYHANGYENNPVEIDFTPPFRRICMIEELEKMANLSIPKDLTSDEAKQYLSDACTKFNIVCPPPQTTARLLEKLVGHFVEVTCVNPTFVIDHPEITSPLAKAHKCKPGLTERFILFVNKFELVNGYTVENDPVVQRQRFSMQVKDPQSGDEESMALDDTLCMALEYGIPPSAGWSLGIDRLIMLLTDSQNIKEVILFPAMTQGTSYTAGSSTGI